MAVRSLSAPRLQRRRSAARASLSDWEAPQGRTQTRARGGVTSRPRAAHPPPSAPRTPVLALLLETLDAGALLGAAAGAAAVIITEQVAFATLPLALPLVALLAGRAAKRLREDLAQQELSALQNAVQTLAEEARSAVELEQGALRPLALLPSLDSRLSALETSLSSATRGMGAAAGALARDAAAASGAAESAAAATARIESALGDSLDDLLRRASAQAEQRDAVLQSALVAELLPPLRAVSMQMLSVAAAAGGAAAGAAAAAGGSAQPPAAPLRLELPDEAVRQLADAIAGDGEARSRGVLLAAEQWSALGERLQRLEQQLRRLLQASKAQAARAGELDASAQREAEAAAGDSGAAAAATLLAEKPAPAGADERDQAARSDAYQSMLASLRPVDAAMLPPPSGRSIPAWLQGAPEQEAEPSLAAGEPLRTALVGSSREEPAGPAEMVRAASSVEPRPRPPPDDAAASPSQLLASGLAALRAGRAEAEAGAADAHFAAAVQLLGRAATLCEASPAAGASAASSAHGNCGNALLARARLALQSSGKERLRQAEEWLVQAGRRYRTALQLSPPAQQGRALQQWGAALALRGQLLAAAAPEDGAQLFAAAAEKFSAAAALDQPPAGAHASLGAALVERADCLARGGAPGRGAVLREAQRALEEALRRDPSDQTAAEILARCDAERERGV